MVKRQLDGPVHSLTRSVVVAGPFPPPVHGQSKNTQIIASDLAKMTRVIKADLSPGSMHRSLGYHLRRSALTVRACVKLVLNGLRPRPALYVPADGGLGLVYTIVLVAVGRVFRHSIFVHHRSFAALDRSSWLMKLAVSVAGQGACHIFLCRKMREKFIAVYPGAYNSMVSSNARHVIARSAPPSHSPALRIGLLSNLDRAKGLYHFIKLVRACLALEVPIIATLAGPVGTSEDADAIARARAEFGERLSYLGPVYDSEKDAFFSSLDVFVFPTEYVNEAQPNVVFEAMSFGLPIIAIERGCLGEDVTPACGLLVRSGPEFVDAAAVQLKAW
ncbi:MAG: glycosyltransferase family 4 protein, partial [Acidobacteriaceae bacterium]|nr:glycosyltransferase family 4 protein [Acidobacteriaceae bacterium]